MFYRDRSTCAWPRWLMAAALLAPGISQAGALLIISKADHVLEVRDEQSLTLKARVPIGPDPHEIEVTADGRLAYISNPGYGVFHEIDVVDLVKNRPLPMIDTSPLLGPHGLAWVKDRLWFTAQGSKALGRYDPAAKRIDWMMGTGQDTTHLLHVTPDGKRVYATNSGSGTVSLFENTLVPPSMPPTGVLPAGAKARMDWVQDIVPAGPGSEGFDVAPDGQELWTVTPDGKVFIISTAAKAVIATVDTGLVGAHRMKFTPDGKHVLIVSVKTGAVAIYAAGSRKLEKQWVTGRGAGVYMDAKGNRAFISCTPDNFVAIVDLKTLTEVGRIDVPRPDGIAISGD